MKRILSLVLAMLLVFSLGAVSVEAGATQTVTNSMQFYAEWITGSFDGGDLERTRINMVLMKDWETGEEYFDSYIDYSKQLEYDPDLGDYQWINVFYYGNIPRSALTIQQRRILTARIVAEDVMLFLFDEDVGDYVEKPVDIDLTFVCGATTVTTTNIRDKVGGTIVTTRDTDTQYYGTTSGTLAGFEVVGEPFMPRGDYPDTNDTLSLHMHSETIARAK